MTRLPEVFPEGLRFGGDAPAHIGILNDYVRIPYANGSSFASQFLYRAFSTQGHKVTVVGPHDPEATEEELPRHHVCLPSLPMRNHPGLYMPMPTPSGLRKVESLGLDVALGQTGSELANVGVWLRWRQSVPFLCVNTIHLPSVYNVLLPDRLNQDPTITALFLDHIIPFIERHSAQVYNHTDGLIVLSRGLKQYWRNRGVKVPISVIPRSVDPNVFDRPAGDDPFPAGAKPGARLLCVCRQTREKGITRLIRIFARHIAPALPDATLTLVGDGPDFDAFVDEAKKLGVEGRVFFLGEQPLTDIPRYYRHADLFAFTSLSETYGQVVSEAMWCGLPVVALDDGMGVSQQIESGVDGVLVSPGPDESQANWRFAKEVFTLLRDPARRRAVADEAERRVRLRADPARCVERYLDAFAEAREHCRATESQRRSSPYRAYTPLARWTWVHSLVVGMGLMRPPATINRNKARAPAWDGAPPSAASLDARWRDGLRKSDVPAAFASAIEELVAEEAGPLSAARLRKFAASYRLVASS